jgi:cellulose synthase/poly-beta-1,6-N-acetylglucosamine synthase-like glycosyltransferase
MSFLIIILFSVQLVVIGFCLYPAFLSTLVYFRSNEMLSDNRLPQEVDYAVIVTAYEQVLLIPDVVNSILKSNYVSYCIYVVADNCDVSTLVFDDPRVIILRPETKLANNIKSHFYAIDHFVRDHERLTIIDSDNVVDLEYFNELNKLFDSGFKAVQGVRRAKNLNSELACLDEAGDIFYRYIDRYLLFNSGSSASLAGSGMAFSTLLYNSALKTESVDGAGFDKLLQYRILQMGHRIAFAPNAIVYDTKTSKSKQLVEQRARWINTWFKYASWGVKMFFSSISTRSWNQALFSIMLVRPPMFLLFFSACILAVLDFLYFPDLLITLILAAIIFSIVFFKSLSHFAADQKIYKSLKNIPKFVYFQLLALKNAKRANKLSVATKHDSN